jgi:MFS family permease
MEAGGTSGQLRTAAGSLDARASSHREVERRLVLFVGAVVFVDTMFYAAIAPLLPGLAHELHLSKLSAGVMTASYPLGTLLGAIPGGILATRAGPRAAVFTGLALLASSTLAFGLLQDAAALDGARLVEGLGGSCSWAGGIAWLSREAPVERRGALIGGALAAAIVGALLGPVIGTVASAVGRAPAFGAVVVVAAALIVQALRLDPPARERTAGARSLRDAVLVAGVAAGMWLVTLPALAAGVLDVLAPLRLRHLGASVAAIGLVFLVAAGLEAVVSPTVGRISDRTGRLPPLRLGLALAAAALACFVLPATPLALGLLVVAIAGTLGVFWAPAMAMLSDEAEAIGLDQGLAAGLMNLAWAAGQVVGAGGGGAVAKASGDALPMLATAALCVLSLLVIASRPPAAA